MLTAAPVIRKPEEEIGAPGMTDFVNIFIASELNKNEYRTTLRHEQAHVWAGHNRRRPKYAKSDIWAIACEMEIARTIYDEQDISNIISPRSRLSRGYLPNTYVDMPSDLLIAEDIYDWLLKNKKDQQPQVCTCCCDFEKGEQTDESNEKEKVIISIMEVRDLLDENDISQKAQEAISKIYQTIKNRPPSLTNEIDALLRVRVEKERSYRRQSRKESQDVIFNGSVSTPRPPLVEIFVDRSGSFSPEKTAMAEDRLKKLLLRYKASIRHDVWYFGDQKLVSIDPGGGGDTPYDLVCHHIFSSRPKIAIIITDDDPVGESVKKVDGVHVICVPVGCSSTKLAAALGGKDVI